MKEKNLDSFDVFLRITLVVCIASVLCAIHALIYRL